MLHGLFCAAEIHKAVIEIYPARRPGADPENRFQQLRTPCAHQPVQAENLSFPYVKGNILQMRFEFSGQVPDG